MDWSNVRVFLAIVREGRLATAARRLGQSQPTMGRRLRALEQSLGQTLFQRTGEGFVLTEEGAAVLADAERMEEAALAFERRLAGSGSQLEGLLRLSSSDWFGTHVLAPVLAEFARLHPWVVVELLTDARLFSLPRREADLVFRIRPFDEPEVIARSLMQIPYAAYLREDIEAPRAGDGTGALLITMDTVFGDMPDAVWLRRVLPSARVAARSNNRDVQGRLCALGVGVAVLPMPLGDSLHGVRQIDLGEPPPSRETWVGYHRDLRRLARLRTLLDLAVKRLGP